VSAVSPAHPFRWPGSVHRKAAPRLARISSLSPGLEIDLAETLDLLEAAVAAHELVVEPPPVGPPVLGSDPVEEEDLCALAAVIPNPERPWDEWNRLGMAFWNASGGSEAGRLAFHIVSAKSTKHDAAATEARWRGYFRSPPNRVRLKTLLHYARQADPSFELPSSRRQMEHGRISAEQIWRAYQARKAVR
jgi:hypothetical protein